MRNPSPHLRSCRGAVTKRISAKRKPGGFPPAAGGGCVAGCGAPRHARDLRRGRSEANGGPQAARSAARPEQARHGPSATPCRMYEREALRARSCGKIPLRATVAGRALRGAASPARACGPPQVPTARAANRTRGRASPGRAASGRAPGGMSAFRHAARKRKPGGFPPGFVLLVVEFGPD